MVSSPRRRGPIQMGPRLRGDDTYVEMTDKSLVAKKPPYYTPPQYSLEVHYERQSQLQ